MSYNLAQISIASNITYKVPVVSTVPAAVSWVCITNKSPFLLSVYVGMHSFYIPAWYYWPIQIDPLNGVTLPINFLTIGDAGLASPPSSWYSATVYEYGEKPPPGLDIPQSIPGQVSIASGSVGVAAGATIAVSGPIAVSGITTPVVLDSGSIPPTTVSVSGITNPVGISGTIPVSGNVGLTAGNSVNIASGTNPVTVSGTVSITGQTVSIDSFLINDNSTVGTIMESTIYGSTDSNIVMKNDGTFNVIEYISATLTALLQIIPGTGLKLGAASRLTEVLGNLLVDGNLTISNTLSLGTTNIGSSSLGVTNALNVNTLVASGLITGSAITTTGAATVSRINTVLGGLSRVTFGNSTTVANSTVTITHGLGATPDIVLIVQTGSGPSGGESFEVSSIGATTFGITSPNISTITVTWIALKF